MDTPPVMTGYKVEPVRGAGDTLVVRISHVFLGPAAIGGRVDLGMFENKPLGMFEILEITRDTDGRQLVTLRKAG